MYDRRVVTLDGGGQPLKQEGRLNHITGCNTQLPTHLTEKSSKEPNL